jgi:hypothetical protein
VGRGHAGNESKVSGPELNSIVFKVQC